MIVLKSGWREYAIRIAAWEWTSELEAKQSAKRAAEARTSKKN